MKFISTRNANSDVKTGAVSFLEAVERGLAPDQGLYVPASWPHIDEIKITDHSFHAIAQKVLTPFLSGDLTAHELRSIVQSAYDFPIPLRYLKNDTAVLELFHGPTAAFKDVAARFLARFMDLKVRDNDTPGAHERRTILVATSGDTGGAVAAAFDGHPRFQVVVLFPARGVSPLQRQQLTCWSDNVLSLEVNGSFDDCQRLVKTLLGDARARGEHGLSERLNFTSANSINIGRLLPQMIYHSAAALWYHSKTGHAPGLIIPTGNLGNAVAAFWARQIGMPIREILLATNANSTLSLFFRTGKYEPRPSVLTLANAMDVGAPSNFERLQNLFPDWRELKKVSSAVSVSDDDIRRAIRQGKKDWGEIWCPHTATAVVARAHAKSPHWIITATAHPAKFSEIVTPLIGASLKAGETTTLEMPPNLARLFDRPSRSASIEPTVDAAARALREWKSTARTDNNA